jgi:DNA-binding MarR family transcriptional regulator
MKHASVDACEAWQLLLKFLLSNRAYLPLIAAELQLSPPHSAMSFMGFSPAPVPMRQIAESMACDASNVTGLVDRLESRGLICCRPSAEAVV